jgi:hypothetical protein
MWKWQGQQKELENRPQQKEQGQKWDILFLPTGVELKETGLEEKSFAIITFVKGCGVLNSLAPKVTGSTVAYGALGLGEFAKTSSFSFPGQVKYLQHYWANGRFNPVKVTLNFGTPPNLTPATFGTQISLAAEKQEIAVFEK